MTSYLWDVDQRDKERLIEIGKSHFPYYRRNKALAEYIGMHEKNLREHKNGKISAIGTKTAEKLLKAVNEENFGFDFSNENNYIEDRKTLNGVNRVEIEDNFREFLFDRFPHEEIASKADISKSSVKNYVSGNSSIPEDLYSELFRDLGEIVESGFQPLADIKYSQNSFNSDKRVKDSEKTILVEDVGLEELCLFNNLSSETIKENAEKIDHILDKESSYQNFEFDEEIVIEQLLEATHEDGEVPSETEFFNKSYTIDHEILEKIEPLENYSDLIEKAGLKRRAEIENTYFDPHKYADLNIKAERGVIEHLRPFRTYKVIHNSEGKLTSQEINEQQELGRRQLEEYDLPWLEERDFIDANRNTFPYTFEETDKEEIKLELDDLINLLPETKSKMFHLTVIYEELTESPKTVSELAESEMLPDKSNILRTINKHMDLDDPVFGVRGKPQSKTKEYFIKDSSCDKANLKEEMSRALEKYKHSS